MSSQDAPAVEALAAAVAAIPYARFLGLRAVESADGIGVVLPYAEHLIGDPTLPALHGGVLGAFMEIAAVVRLSLEPEVLGRPKTIDMTVEYLRSGRPRDTYAHAQIRRLGRRIANVRVEAWQEDPGAPIAALHGHFLLPEARRPERSPVERPTPELGA